MRRANHDPQAQGIHLSFTPPRRVRVRSYRPAHNLAIKYDPRMNE